jgi:hypothetical protein
VSEQFKQTGRAIEVAAQENVKKKSQPPGSTLGLKGRVEWSQR